MTSKIGSGLCGLDNLGNTCYMNSIIQCLCNITLLREHFINKEFISNIHNNRKEIPCEWYKIVNTIWTNEDGYINPNDFHKIIQIQSVKESNGEFVGYRQCDAHEFLNFFLDQLHESLTKEITVNIKGQILNANDKIAFESMKQWKSFYEKKYSIIVKLFGGQYYSNVIKGNNISSNFDPFFTLEIEIPNSENITLYDCLDNFTDKEELDIEDPNNIKTYKKIQFWNLPQYLIICLKRFNKMQKITRHISYPINELDLSKYCEGYFKYNSKYTLSSVCIHSGVLGGGHYFSYCKRGGSWYKFNDRSVDKIDESILVNRNAYCLFYEKIQ